MFSSINSAALPLNSTGKLKIYSALSNGFRLTNGIKHEQAGLAIIGSNHFNWNSECEESIKTVLRVLRPLPEIVVLGGFKTGNFSISEEFGCAVEAAENKMTAAETFNTLIDDNRRDCCRWAGEEIKMILLLFFMYFVASYQQQSITPIVIYHGLGDNCCSANMLRLIERIKGALPGVFIHSVRIGKTPEEDRKRSLLDNMNRQIKEVCNQLAGIPELAEGFNAIGLSQGGQFLRAYVERCNKPRVKKLITLGSQHQGVMTLPGCIERSEEGNLSIEEAEAANAPRSNFFQIFSVKNQSNRDFFRRSFIGKLVAFFNSDGNCSWWKRLLKLGVYSPFVRSEVVQAQYFKDPRNLEAYFDNNQFLLDINNDSPDRQKWNPSYADNLSSLDAFYMYIFEEDSVVVPKESGWFALQDPKDPKIKYLKELSIYKEDRLGLKKMDEEGKLFFRKLPGEHLKLSNDFLTIELPQILL